MSENIRPKKGPARIPIVERLARRTVETVAPSHCPEIGACREWTGATNGRYGVIGRGGHGAGKDYTHRVSYELHVGPIPDGMQVCHHCDNPLCVRPDHLFVGTAGDNADDKVAKGRTLFGSKHKLVRLTETQVNEMRVLWSSGEFSLIELAERFGTTKVNVSQIVRGDRWKHLLPADWVPPEAGRWSSPSTAKGRTHAEDRPSRH